MTLTKRNLARRQFLRGALAVAGGAAMVPALNSLGLLAANGRVAAAPGSGGYGQLAPKPDLRDGALRIKLPEGFQYRSFSASHSGMTMSDGLPVPLGHDGMDAFGMPDGTLRLVRNHEDRNPPNVGSIPGAGGYDSAGGGGTTTLVVNPDSRSLIQDFVSLKGTTVNCAGGRTPWNSWLTCEETNAGPATWPRQHGYVFDVPASANGPVNALPLTLLGRFAHEAIAVDPQSGIVYETEDNGDNSGFYRFVPNSRGNLTAGKLQMLAIDGVPKYDTRRLQVIGKKWPVTWVDIPNPNPAGTGASDVFNQGFNAGGARFRRLEGCWYGGQSIFFNATDGGDIPPGDDQGRGQVWEFRPSGSGGGWLSLIFESPSINVLNMPDNITVTPQGSVLLCEDGGDAPTQYLRGVTPAGQIFDFASNNENDSEWAGACFALHGNAGANAPDALFGKHATLFVNRQGATRFTDAPEAGMTFAIWGPWKDGAL